MRQDAQDKRLKTALWHQLFWCTLLLGMAASWLYQNLLKEAAFLSAGTAIYLMTLIANHRLRNKLILLCLAPAIMAILLTTFPLLALWRYFFTILAESPLSTQVATAFGVISLNSLIGIVAPVLICRALWRARESR